MKAKYWKIVILLAVFLLPAAAMARTALVIGNSTYASSPLVNPANDATDIAEKLRALDFDVEVLIDSTRREMRRGIREYSERLKTSGGVGLFYYAGHGMQIKGVNYLIPIDAEMNNEFEIPDEAVSANAVLRAVEEAGNDLNIVVLDACRDNPFAKSYRSAATRGLARMDAPGGSIIAYATAPGNVALDGLGRNGVYTKHLLDNMDKPGMPIEQMFKKVRIGVIDESGGQQTPWEESSLRSDFYFAPAQVYEVVIPEKTKTVETLTSIPVEIPAAQSEQQQPIQQLVNTQSTVQTAAVVPAQKVSQSPQLSATSELLAKAAIAMNDYRLTTPERDNALFYYREVLGIDPVNLEAHDGLQMITRRYISLAEREIRNSDPSKAHTFITRGLEIQPENYKLKELQQEAAQLELQRTLLAARAEAESKQTQQPAIETVAPASDVGDAVATWNAARQPEPVEIPALAPQAPVEVESSLQNATTQGGLEPEPVEQVSDATADMTLAESTESESDEPASHTERMKQDFNKDVKVFKESVVGLGKSLKSGIGGLFKRKSSQSDSSGSN